MSMAGSSAAPKRALFFTKSSGYEHAVIRWADGQPSFSERILQRLGADHGIDFTFSKDGSLFSSQYLADFDAVFFFTSGDLTAVGTDGHPAMTAAGKQALVDWVAAGGGFLAVHSGADTFHTLEHGGGVAADRSNRYRLHREKADPYIRMLGGEFINHGRQQEATATVADPRFPGFDIPGGAWRCREEWYSNKEFADDLHVLLVMQSREMEGVDYDRPPYPLAWARTFGEGRVWFNGMGHREDVWEAAQFQRMLLGGIDWVTRRVEADVTPNTASITPDGNVLPPPRPAA
jgi:type 1 glutamine amidotransferase